MKKLKDYRPEEFGAQKDEINSLIMEQAAKTAVERMKKVHGLPFEAFTEPDIEEGKEADENTPTHFKEEYSDEFNELYDKEYDRIAGEIGFDISEDDGIQKEKKNSEDYNDPFYSTIFRHGDSEISRGELESLPCPFCTLKVSDEQMTAIVKQIDVQTRMRLGLSSDEQIDLKHDKHSLVWWGELETAVNDYHVPYYEDLPEV